jgi:DNA-binding transcriptional LysR family regulator
VARRSEIETRESRLENRSEVLTRRSQFANAVYESRIPNPESRIPNPESRIPNPESRIPNPESVFRLLTTHYSPLTRSNTNPESHVSSSMDLRHLRHFVAVAEELHFARAAKKLGMAQPPLSQSIMRLEESLGTRLLDRDSRRVRLTPAGAALLGEAREVLARASLAERTVRRVASGEIARLRIGFVPMSAMRILPQAMIRFQRRWPNVEVRLYERTSQAQIDGVREGTLEVGIVVHDAASTKGLEVRVIERYSYVAVIPAGWALAKQKSVRLAELAGQPLIMFPQQMRDRFFQPFSAACRRAGFVPRVAQKIVQPYTMFNLVANGLGVGIVQDTASSLRISGVAFVPIRDLPEFSLDEVAVIWMPGTASPALLAMVDIVGQLAMGRRGHLDSATAQ